MSEKKWNGMRARFPNFCSVCFKRTRHPKKLAAPSWRRCQRMGSGWIWNVSRLANIWRTFGERACDLERTLTSTRIRYLGTHSQIFALQWDTDDGELFLFSWKWLLLTLNGQSHFFFFLGFSTFLFFGSWQIILVHSSTFFCVRRLPQQGVPISDNKKLTKQPGLHLLATKWSAIPVKGKHFKL